MSLLDRIAECNNADLSAYRPFYAAGQRVGWIGAAMAERLAPFADVFRMTADGIWLPDDLDTPQRRTEAVDRVLRVLAGEGAIPCWRDEAYPVTTGWGREPLFVIDRGAAPLLGVTAYGLHVNGYVRRAGVPWLWIGRRADDRPVYPGLLDNMVAGGQPAGLSLAENLVKEAAEEAGIGAALAQHATPVGALTYTAETHEGLRPDVLFCYDLELPDDFTPRNEDGEIAEFYLWPAEKALRIVAETNDFKFNCNLVVIDFAVRHGLLDPDRSDYLDIVMGLRG